MSEQQTFGQLVRAHREALGLTQEQLAREIPCNLRTIQRVEAGQIQTPKRTTLFALVKRLGIEESEIKP